MKSIDLKADIVGEMDAALIITDHKAVDYESVLEHAQLVVDTRGIFRDRNGKVQPA